LALLIAGPGTSLPAAGAVAVIAKGRVLGLYLAFILIASLIFGYVFQMI